jgi:hypothetical protein
LGQENCGIGHIQSLDASLQSLPFISEKVGKIYLRLFLISALSKSLSPKLRKEPIYSWGNENL